MDCRKETTNVWHIGVYVERGEQAKGPLTSERAKRITQDCFCARELGS